MSLILGNILKIYRKSMPIKEVADKINRKIEDIENLEKGSDTPDIYTRALLAKLYTIPFELLMYDYNQDIDAIINCRAVGDFNELPKEYQFIFANKVDNLLKMINIYEQEIGELTYNDFISINKEEALIMSKATVFDDNIKNIIKAKANEMRLYYKYTETGSLNNFLDKVLQTSLDIVFSKMPDGYNGISFIPNKNNLYFIFINSGDHYCKQTFTLLHEIGHIIFSDVENSDLIEEYVNYFANMVLLPQQKIKNLFNNFNIDNIKEYINIIRDISKEYEVSYKTIFYSLYHLNLITDKDFNGTFKDFINKIVLTNFEEEYNLDKPSFRYNSTLNNIQKELIEKNLLNDTFVLQMNFGQPFIN